MKRKLSAVLLSVAIVANAVGTPVAFAAPDRPDRPDRPDLPESTQPVSTPAPTQAPESPAPTPVGTPEPTVAPSSSPVPTPTPVSTPEPVEKPDKPRLPGQTPEPTPQPVYDNSEFNESGSSLGNADGNTDADTTVETGNADADGSISNVGNANTSSSTKSGVAGSGITIENDKNGANSENSGSVSLEQKDETIQLNDADIQNKLEVETDTGKNSASKNTGGDSTIITGDANTTGTILNSVNTNVDGVMISEFNIIDNHVGDYVLDFESNCIAGCGSGIDLSNTSNGAGSDNDASLDLVDTQSTFQANDANILNDMVLTADTGHNHTNKNTNGNNYIQTGDASVSGSVVNMANNNFAGNVVYGVVNIFGELVGDLIIPDEQLASILGVPYFGASNTGNGSGSVNSADIDTIYVDDYYQQNDATIVNNLNLDANTGDNDMSRNTNGNGSIMTGSSSVDVNVVNIANNNVVGGDWWFVLVNNAGEWMGQLVGASDSVLGNFMAASAGTGFDVTEDGIITVSNEGNGANSQNTGDVNVLSTDTVNQQNNAVITNNITLDANTGDNTASRNTGGTNEIETGDANVVLNLVNFVNNNFAGGNVFMGVVNIFGGLTGNICIFNSCPSEQIAGTDSHVGGQSDVSSGHSESHGQSTESSGPSDSSEDKVESFVSPTPIAFASAAGPFGTLIELATVSAGDEQPESEEVALGISTENVNSQSTGIRLNLAWLVVIIPAGLGVAVVVKKGYLAKLAGLLPTR